MINGCCDVVTFQLSTYPTPLLNGRGLSSCLQGTRGMQVVLLINRIIQQGVEREIRALLLANMIPPRKFENVCIQCTLQLRAKWIS